MVKPGFKPEAQFKYWDLRRKGMTQAEISRKFEITRQAVNKSMKLAERDILYRLLETAQTSGILVEWQDAKKGVLIGISPQLGNMGCIMAIDENNKIRIFYDQRNNMDPGTKKKVLDDLERILNDSIGIKIEKDEEFKDLIKEIVRWKIK